VRGSGTAVEVDLRLEQVLFLIQDWHPDAAREAASVKEMARVAAASEARAQLMLAFAVGGTGSDAGPDEARDALEMARRGGDGALECEAAYVLADCLAAHGRADEAYSVVIEMVERARELGLRSRELELLHIQAYLELYARGELERCNERCRLLLREPAALGEHVVRTRSYLAYGLASLGHGREAQDVLAQAADEADTTDDRAVVLNAMTEVEWLGRRLHAALEVVDSCRREATPFIWPATVVGAWSAYELGTEQPELPSDPFPRVIAGAAPELRALSRLAGGDPASAEPLFIEAAGLWDRCFIQAAIRSLWGAGQAALLDGNLDRARDLLVQAERRAERAGLKPLLSRIRGSLREAGVLRSSPRAAANGLLTTREREVLELVGAGLRTREIAMRLGLASSTVDSHVKSAMRKLGTRTRAQAALAVSDGDH